MHKACVLALLFVLLVSPSGANESSGLVECPPKPEESAGAYQSAIRSVPQNLDFIAQVGDIRAHIPVPFVHYPHPVEIGCINTDKAFHFEFWMPSRNPPAVPPKFLEAKPTGPDDVFFVSLGNMKPSSRASLSRDLESTRESVSRWRKAESGPGGVTFYPYQVPGLNGPHETFLYEDAEYIFLGKCRPTFCSGDIYYGGFVFDVDFLRQGLPHWKETARAAVEMLETWKIPAD